MLQRAGELFSDLLAVDDSDVTESESSVELNLMAVQFEHKVKRTKKKPSDEK